MHLCGDLLGIRVPRKYRVYKQRLHPLQASMGLLQVAQGSGQGVVREISLQARPGGDVPEYSDDCAQSIAGIGTRDLNVSKMAA